MKLDPLIVRAFGKALAVWVATYVLIVHALVIWKWSSYPVNPPVSDHPTDSVVVENGNIQESYETVVATLQASIEKRHSDLQSLQTTVQELQALVQDYENTRGVVAQQRLDLQQRKQHMADALVRHMDESTDLKADPEQMATLLGQAFDVSKFDLRRYENLSEEPELFDTLWQLELEELYSYETAEDLEQAFTEAIRALEQAQIETSPARKRDLYQRLNLPQVRTYYENMDWRSIFSKSCSALVDESDERVPVQDVDEDRQDEIDRFVTTQLGLLNMQFGARSQRTFKNVNENGQIIDMTQWPLVLQPVYESFEDAFQKQVDDIIEYVKAHHAHVLEETDSPGTPTKSTATCINQPYQTVRWLEAGLLAWYKRSDIRQAIIDCVREDYGKDTNVILDAVLLSDVDNYFGDSNTPPPSLLTDKVTLRQLLDTPFVTQQGGSMIDQLIDTISGYNDSLDQWMDETILSILQQHEGKMPKDDSAGVGRVIIQRLLRMAGKVEIPRIQKA